MTTRMFKFSADEVFEMALQIESNGAKFYERAAELQDDEHARSTLLELAAMEQDHQQTFADMRSQLSAAERKETVFDPDEELPLYLRAMADKNVFNARVDPSEQLSEKPKMEDVLRMAIGLEKDSIVFYLGMKEVVPERLGVARLDNIVKEEMGHIATLGELIRCARL